MTTRLFAGSGIPEMKTILRGVALKEYLTFKTLVAKVIGLTVSLKFKTFGFLDQLKLNFPYSLTRRRWARECRWERKVRSYTLPVSSLNSWVNSSHRSKASSRTSLETLRCLLQPAPLGFVNRSYLLYTSVLTSPSLKVGSCFASPVGGVLFSIEVTTTYFAVRNYWRGFFGAVCGATFFRLLAVWFQKSDTLTALFLTNFTMDFPYDPQELLVFAFIG